MNRFAFSIFTLCLSLCLSGAAAFAQNPVNPNTSNAARPSQTRPANSGSAPATLNAQITNAERTQNADQLLLAYGQAVTDADLARAAIAQLLASYYRLRNQAQTAEQATQAVAEANLRFQVLQAAQNQIQIAQNQQLLEQNARIISLLQQNAKAK